jgi:hypothetical protein
VFNGCTIAKAGDSKATMGRKDESILQGEIFAEVEAEICAVREACILVPLYREILDYGKPQSHRLDDNGMMPCARQSGRSALRGPKSETPRTVELVVYTKCWLGL